MDENQEQFSQEELTEEPNKPYTPRPAWQVWGARIALVIFIVYLFMYYVNVMRGGG